ncbi:MAG TPA: glutaredoxin domain-containing protein [Armatimonadota bacterium]|nr:glutaredoxin domain-containing protein [Armatimonadota bacterium]
MGKNQRSGEDIERKAREQLTAVEIYTTRFCPFCDRAKRLFKLKGIPFEERELDHLSDAELNDQMKKLSGQRTVPQIVINGKAIGGWQELSDLERTGRLDAMLREGVGSAA